MSIVKWSEWYGDFELVRETSLDRLYTQIDHEDDVYIGWISLYFENDEDGTVDYNIIDEDYLFICHSRSEEGAQTKINQWIVDHLISDEHVIENVYQGNNKKE